MKNVILSAMVMATCLFVLPGTYSQAEARMHPGCFQPKKTGPCRASIKRFYYNKKTRNCHVFYWGGCKPNANNFKTLRACRSACYVRPRYCPVNRKIHFKNKCKCPRGTYLRRLNRTYRICSTKKPCPTCKTIRCKAGYRCLNIKGCGKCVKCATCRTMRCKKGYRCTTVGGCGKCVKCATCRNIRCKKGYRCATVNGCAKCVRCTTCRTMRCAKGYTCRDTNGCGKCHKCPPPRPLARPPHGCRYLPYNYKGCKRYKLVCSCRWLRCRKGYKCVLRGRIPVCVK